MIDLSKLPHQDKEEYLRELLPLLATLRRQSGLPHKILIDEAHYYLGEPDGRHLVDAELAGKSWSPIVYPASISMSVPRATPS